VTRAAAGALGLLLVGCGATEAQAPRATTADEGSEARARCARSSVSVQVLGSGGPIPDDDRASASYLVWVDGRARALIDAGGGLVPRFGAAGARVEDLDVVAITHLHVDHAGGLSALLKGGYFSDRDRALPILGPDGNDAFVSIAGFVDDIVGPEGAFRYLHGYVDGSDPFALEPRVVTGDETRAAYEGPRVRVEARRVRHGNAPALGYLVRVGDARIAFAGDQSAAGREAFASLAEGADLLVAHHAVPMGAGETLRGLHATPAEIGELAAGAGAGRLVLSHNMRRALDDRARGLAAIRDAYRGPVDVANDLDCYAIGR